jgi:hypothetical protein
MMTKSEGPSNRALDFQKGTHHLQTVHLRSRQTVVDGFHNIPIEPTAGLVGECVDQGRCCFEH